MKLRDLKRAMRNLNWKEGEDREVLLVADGKAYPIKEIAAMSHTVEFRSDAGQRPEELSRLKDEIMCYRLALERYVDGDEVTSSASSTFARHVLEGGDPHVEIEDLRGGSSGLPTPK